MESPMTGKVQKSELIWGVKVKMIFQLYSKAFILKLLNSN